MHRIPQRWLLPVACAIVAAAAQAQDPRRSAAPPDPLDAEVTVPAFVYRSPLSSFRRTSDDKPIGWREANDTVGRIGGWRAYAREASEAAAVERSPAPTQAPSLAGHGRHGTKHGGPQ